jgi:hypothetical protein
MMNDESKLISRRKALLRGSAMLAAIAVTVSGGAPAFAADAVKKKKKASKDEFFFQEEPGEGGKQCSGCVNFEPTTGNKGTCALVEGEVCTTCYCQGWTDKRTGKKAGT